ncbi:oxidoreductase [Rhodococcoides yunnanense]|uniref:oxidoreductase n=1 Tax=Rhodococcoides yunnanense TaxID=278209 RepID=UPI001FE32C11|nr:oxidoreductase [Rhodococcus yunnanensis]
MSENSAGSESNAVSESNAGSENKQRRVILTGGNTGIGYFTALELVKQGDHVTLACRNLDKAGAAAEKISRQAPEGTVDTAHLDLSDLGSVRSFAESAPATIDVLINNAGVMMPSKRTETKDGFELQFGTNHLGHFALTGHLLPNLRSAHNATVVTVSSVAHKQGPKLDFDDLQATSGYQPQRMYANSKLANLLFALELQRRLDKAGIPITSNAAHPGISETALYTSPDGLGSSKILSLGASIGLKFISQSAQSGALPTLYALESGEKGSYTGPKSLFESRGAPGPAKVSKTAKDPALAEKLWNASESLTGVVYDFG